MRFSFNFDTVSFLLGMAVATVIWWVITLTRPLLEQTLEANKARQKERALQASSGMEDAHRKIVYKQTQGIHLAASLFALDEIVETPRLLAPPVYYEPNGPRSHQDIVEQALPYMPDCPELGAIYGSPSLAIAEALSGGMNIIITGQPGMGKTTALAHLASQIVNRAPAVQALHQYIPFFIHVADMGLPLANPQKPEDFLTPIVEKLAQSAGIFDQPRLPHFVQFAFTSGRALLLLDGVDELPQAAIQEVTDYLRVILRQYSKSRVITTGAPEYVDGLLSLGFSPLAIMPWGREQQADFLNKWTALWEKFVAMESWAQTSAAPLDPVLLNRWLSTDNLGLTPLEFTLKVWAAYAGDVRGVRPADAIEAHIRRLMPSHTPFEALYVVGAQASLNGLSIFDPRRAREWTKSFEPAAADQAETVNAESVPAEDPQPEAEAGNGEATPHPEEPKKNSAKGNTQPIPAARTSLISQLAGSGLLNEHSGGRLRFSHLIFQGYLAGKGLGGTNVGETLLKQPVWAGQTTTLRYMAAFGNISGILNSLVTMDDPILLRPKMVAGRLLRDAPRNAAWRGTVMATLVQVLQNEDFALGLRGQAMVAIALSGDVNAGALFRQLMAAPSNELRQLAALGAGIAQDPKSVEALVNVIANTAGMARLAACLALVEIGTSQALEAVATALLRGDEQLRIAAAEALANNYTEGREALREGLNSQDILLRRAIVFGLGRVYEPWANELLEKAQLQDEQWAVRNVAVEILDARQNPNPHVPKRLTAPSETPWLIEFAGKYGMGVAPGQPATDTFILALKDENIEYREAALQYLKNTPTDGVLAALYPYLFGTDPEIKEDVYQVLHDMALGGTILPHPMKFGLG